MVDIPVKKYRVRRAKNWLKQTLVPFELRSSKIRVEWGRWDASDRPPSSQTGIPGLARYEFNWLSQNGEDGVVRYLFDQIGCEYRRFVEFGFFPLQRNSLHLMKLMRYQDV